MPLLLIHWKKIVGFLLMLSAILALVGLAGFVLLRPSGFFSQLPSVTVTSFDHVGDPVNIAFVADKDSIMKAFLAAHWLVPDPIGASSTARIIRASVMRTAYRAAPVSDLYLLGRSQDLAFELPTDSISRRHHVRLWQTSNVISGKPLWLGSASYDSGLELSGTTALPTHHISPDVDEERDFIAKSLGNANMQDVSSERISYPSLWGFNGAGDWYFDDGLVTVLTLR